MLTFVRRTRILRRDITKDSSRREEIQHLIRYRGDHLPPYRYITVKSLVMRESKTFCVFKKDTSQMTRRNAVH